jgi:hypothetical protein
MLQYPHGTRKQKLVKSKIFSRLKKEAFFSNRIKLTKTKEKEKIKKPEIISGFL